MEKVNSINFKNNSFNFIRLMAVAQVIFGHCVIHMKLPVNDVFYSVSSIFQGVPIFFMLSGFFIWDSLERTPDLKTFVKKRILRLYPELWCAVVLSIISILILYDKYKIGELGLFALCQSTFFQFWTPASLRDYGCGTPNGSLWTVLVMVQFYFLGWIIKKIKSEKAKTVILFLGMFLSIAIELSSEMWGSFIPDIICKLYKQTVVPYFWLFIFGLLIKKYFDKLIPIFKRFWYIGLALLLVVCITGFDIVAGYGIIKAILQAFTWFGFAYAVPKLNIKVDISYGMYVYHMVVVNVMINFGAIGSYMWFALAVIITIALSVISYLLISKQGLLKRVYKL